MTKSTAPREYASMLRPDYGIDAPQVIRNLFLIGAGLVVLGIVGRHGIVLGGGKLILNVQWFGYATGGACIVEGILMILYAKVGKFHHRDVMLGLRAWRGDERVLDVGTGRGLLMVGAARVAPSGSVVGIDIWRGEDLTGNTAEATRANLRLEGVDRISELQSMPAQAMTFGDECFDVVMSNLCLHNIDARRDRESACREIVRVLKPGGVALISDFRHTEQYASAFRALGCEARRTSIDLMTFPWLRVVVVQKPGNGEKMSA